MSRRGKMQGNRNEVKLINFGYCVKSTLQTVVKQKYSSFIRMAKN